MLLLLPSATYRAADFLAAAEGLGVEIAVASERRQAMSALMGDRALVIPLRRPEEAADRIVALAERTPLDAVVAVDDGGVATAALASERLGLEHNSPRAALAARDKGAMRAALAKAGVTQPRHRPLARDEDAGEAASEVGLPCVIKPVGLSGSRGVIRADDPAGARAAAERVRAILAAAGEDAGVPLLVEQFVPGAEVAVEGLLRSGRLETLAIFDKPDPLDGPFFEETIYVTPSRLPGDVQAAVGHTVAAAAAALELREGPVHAELRLPGGPPVVLELAARSIGGLCSRALRFGAGVSLEEVILRHALGLPLEGLRREAAASGVMMIPVPSAGRLREVAGQEGARSIPGVVGLEISIPPGGTLVPLPEGDRYLGFIFARGNTPEEVEVALRAAHAELDVVAAAAEAA